MTSARHLQMWGRNILVNITIYPWYPFIIFSKNMRCIPGYIPLLLGSKACIYISCSGNTTENSRPVVHNGVRSRSCKFSDFWWLKKCKSNHTLLGKYYAKTDAETDLLQNMKGSFDKENTNANVRLEYKVPILKQKTYDKRQR